MNPEERAALVALVAKWRDVAATANDVGVGMACGLCASDLEAALSPEVEEDWPSDFCILRVDPNEHR
jgi:hypothetical protein